MKPQPNKRILLIIVSAIDALLSGIILIIYFGLLPINISSSLGIQPWAVGLCGGVWFTISISILIYQLTKTETIE
jgi:hypothetical protein